MMMKHLQKTPRELSIENGKRIVFLIIGFLILAEAFLLVVKLITNQSISIVDIGQISNTVALSVFQGQNWAKLFLAFGTGLGTIIGVYTLYVVIINPAATLFAFIFALLLTIFSGMSAYYLTFSSDIDEFLRSQKT